MGGCASMRKKVTVNYGQCPTQIKNSDIRRKSLITLNTCPSQYKKNKKLNRISKASWINVLDYLAFNELKEVGKVNRSFNSIAKSTSILVKFFKKKPINDTFYISSDSTNATSLFKKVTFCSFNFR